jgi:hypothetical protein
MPIAYHKADDESAFLIRPFSPQSLTEYALSLTEVFSFNILLSLLLCLPRLMRGSIFNSTLGGFRGSIADVRSAPDSAGVPAGVSSLPGSQEYHPLKQDSSPGI